MSDDIIQDNDIDDDMMGSDVRHIWEWYYRGDLKKGENGDKDDARYMYDGVMMMLMTILI